MLSGNDNCATDCSFLLSKNSCFTTFTLECDAFLNGRCYKAHDEFKTWNQARETCIAGNGNLAIVCDAETNDMLKNTMELKGGCQVSK